MSPDPRHPALAAQPAWETLTRREVFAAPPWIRVAVEDVRLPSGRVVSDFFDITLPDFVVIVAQTEDGAIIAEDQYKHGVRKASLMLPAGIINPGESPLDCAKRELLEETGFRADDWTALGTFVVDGNRRCGLAHFYHARRAQKQNEPPPDALEPLAVRLMSPADFLSAIRRGEVVALAHATAFLLAQGLGHGRTTEAQSLA
ncbi:MAG: NUDIX hydrolase [Vicinamibacteria bacterium]|jgi:ADP-ribose pyrophosphatase|nr:NUDIX hydrolase [Vicinamibacteria bacterium]